MVSQHLIEAVEAAEDRAASFIETSAEGFAPVLEVIKSNGDIGVVFLDSESWGDGDVRVQQLMYVGKQMREMTDDIETVIIVSEAWSKTLPLDETPPASIKDDPGKIEVLVISGASREENFTVMVDIFRDEDNKITLTKDRKALEGGESRLTDYFWKGYDGDVDKASRWFSK